MRSSNVQGFVSRVLTLYEEKEEEVLALPDYGCKKLILFQYELSYNRDIVLGHAYRRL